MYLLKAKKKTYTIRKLHKKNKTKITQITLIKYYTKQEKRLYLSVCISVDNVRSIRRYDIRCCAHIQARRPRQAVVSKVLLRYFVLFVSLVSVFVILRFNIGGGLRAVVFGLCIKW